MKNLFLIVLALGSPSGGQPDDHAGIWLAGVQAERWHVPSLRWEPRSDWVMPAAKGDGVADDTDALQAALDKLGDRFGTPKTVFLPEGTYRLTRTLKLSKIQGAAVIGQGALTKLVWDGAAGERMFHSNGASRSRYVGLCWDGRGKAAVGIDHDSKTYYETRVRHEQEEFVNFSESGIRVGHEQTQASAEIMFMGCRFDHCGRGISFLAFNDYNNSIERCVFVDCGTGVFCHRGNLYARDCHFARSREQDFLLPPHGHSIRRTTSLGSACFIKPSQEGRHPLLLAVEDCVVSGWTDPKGAIFGVNRGPLQIVDCVFLNPPSKAAPIQLTNPGWMEQVLIHSNCRSPFTDRLVNPGERSRVIEIPAGRRGSALLSKPDRRFAGTPRTAGRVFDAKRDFGAKGDNVTDDTRAVRSTIAAAAAHGKGAVAYFPSGFYRVSEPIELTGADYTVAGCGFHTQLNWAGPSGGVVVAVKNPRRISLEQLALWAPQPDTCLVLHTSPDGACDMTYDGVYVSRSMDKPCRAIEIVGLPKGSIVRGVHVDGGLKIVDSARAAILVRHWYGGSYNPLLVEGVSPARDGFFGVLNAVSSLNTYDLVVRDNQDLVIGDFYSESTHHHVLLEGGDGPAGRVTVHGAKMHVLKEPDRIKIRNYSGRFAYVGGGFGHDVPIRVDHEGTRPLDLLLFGNAFRESAVETKVGKTVRVTLAGNLVFGTKRPVAEDASFTLPDVMPEGSSALMSAVLDDFRELGEWDLALRKETP
jgi:hypothetical protein